MLLSMLAFVIYMVIIFSKDGTKDGNLEFMKKEQTDCYNFLIGNLGLYVYAMLF